MHTRTFVAAVTFVGVAVLVLLQFLVPSLTGFVTVGLLAWFFVALFVFRWPSARQMTATGGDPGSSVVPGTVGPNPGRVGEAALSPTLDFCPFCANAVIPGTPVCPDCHHRIPVF